MGSGCGARAAPKYAPENQGNGGTQAGTAGGDISKQQHKSNNADFQDLMKFLMKVPVLSGLPAHQHPILAKACEHVDFKAGDILMQQGDEGKDMFLIKQGKATVRVQDESGLHDVSELKSGDYCGEQALMTSAPRTATVVAAEPVEAVRITQDKFRELELDKQVRFANRKVVGFGANKAATTKPPDPKTLEEVQLLRKALANNANLSAMVDLTSDRINSIVDLAWKETVEAGKEVITENDIDADYFYMVSEGSFDISTEAAGFVGNAGVGGSFGELALLYLAPRAATVKATSNATVWVIDRGNFKDILMKSTKLQLEMYLRLIDKVQVLDPLLQVEKEQVAQALVEMHFTRDEIILQQGDVGCTFYILYEGEVAIVVDNQETSRLEAHANDGECKLFGERALLEDQPRAATVVVVSETAKVLALDRRSFELLLGPLVELKDAGNGEKRQAAKKPGMPGKTGGTVGSVKFQRTDLKRIGLLGCGGFGSVELWEHKSSGETYAMKGLSKGFVVRTGMQEAVMNEKNILMMTDSAFIIKLYATFNGTQMLYFLLEPALGGELYQTYSRKNLHGSEKHARFYLVCVVFAFEHLHDRCIIYRDLKPENLLFTDKGHVKLTDMGLAKFVVGKTFTTCGTPDYFAPELIKSAGHTVALDWWTLGILLFELLAGHPPFESAYPMQIYSKVLRGFERVACPKSIHGDAHNLVTVLLDKDPEKRLPMRSGGTKNIQNHAWYTSLKPDSQNPTGKFDWDAVLNGTMAPPYKPAVRSKTDIANFSARKEDIPRPVEYHDDGSGWDKDFATN
mmetsp:Transcript_31695/g.80018  ORF Transcript_31695/g.80018 Transcript_31695/m.80018 type:complete len:799 (-) Transcript_31695:373-2769(-)